MAMAPSSTAARNVFVSTLLIGLLVTAGTGCAADADDDGAEPGGETDAALRDGVFTYERPEIGSITTNGSFCTATLISPNVVLTAAHCVDFVTKDTPGRQLGGFVIQGNADPASRSRYGFDAITSFGRSSGKHDIAVVRLVESVPANVAKPAGLATATPTDRSNEKVTIFGYGCSDRPGVFSGGGSDDHSYRKQKREFEMGPIRYICPGDSGGPTVRGLYGDVFRVSSKLYNAEIFGWGRQDAFGDVVAHRQEIVRQVEAWKPSNR